MRNDISYSTFTCNQVLQWMADHENNLPVLLYKATTDAQRAERLLRRQFNYLRRKKRQISRRRSLLYSIRLKWTVLVHIQLPLASKFWSGWALTERSYQYSWNGQPRSLSELNLFSEIGSTTWNVKTSNRLLFAVSLNRLKAACHISLTWSCVWLCWRGWMLMTTTYQWKGRPSLAQSSEMNASYRVGGELLKGESHIPLQRLCYLLRSRAGVVKQQCRVDPEQVASKG
jgi:hypothetical protein